MPRAGLTGGDVVAAAAGLADETGYTSLTMGLLADRLGVRPPSLYKHVGGLADLQHRVAILAMTELGEVIRDAVQGRAGFDALAALLTAVATSTPNWNNATLTMSIVVPRCWIAATTESSSSFAM